MASKKGHHDVVKTLLGAGADVNITTSDVSVIMFYYYMYMYQNWCSKWSLLTYPIFQLLIY